MEIKVIMKRLNKKILPVISVSNVDKIDGIARFLIENGYDAAEITYRTDAASEAIRRFKRDYGFLVAAGTVLDRPTVISAVQSGADFIVSPGYGEEVAEACIEGGIPYVPGVETAGEIMRALARGFKFLKFFPAEAAGGIAKLKALAAPFPNVKFMPTGGITAQNVEAYLETDCVLCAGGTFVVPKNIS